MNTQKFFLTTAILLLSALSASAYDFTVGGMCYNFIEGTNNVEFTREDYPNTYKGDIIILETVSWEGKVYQVTEIGDWTFNGANITSCQIPNTITKIGSYAFWGTDLSNITIPASVTTIKENALGNMKNLTSINVNNNNSSFSSSNGMLFDKEKTILLVYPAGKTETIFSIPSSVNIIGRGAFNNCSNLISINIPESVTIIENETFENCENLSSIIIPNSVTSIGSSAFSYCRKLKSVVLPNSIERIEYRTFSSCQELTNITIPESVKYIDTYAFEDCSNLVSITISAQTIGSYAFYNCTSLESISFSNNVQTIGTSAFRSCKITSVKIPNSVTSISGSVFSNCNSFIEVIIDDDNPNYTTEDGILYNKDKTSLILYPSGKVATTFIVPNTIKTIGEYAFYFNTKLISIALPEGLETIGQYAFCPTKIESIVLPNTLKEIGYASFEGSYIKSITIPASVESISSWAFTKCPYLKSIVFEGIVEYMGGVVFAGYASSPRAYTIEVKCEPFKIDNSLGYVDLENSILVVPDGMKELFLAAAGWQDFGTILEKSQVVPVTNITGVPTEAIAGTDISFVGKVTPENAFCQTIVWSVNDAGTTGAMIYNNTANTTLYAPTAGTVEITATIADGIAVGINYTQNFSITVNANTGIAETTQQSNQIYPNPTVGMVYTEKDSDIKVYNSQGVLLQSVFGSQVDLSVYPKGLYLLQINGEMIKVIKK